MSEAVAKRGDKVVGLDTHVVLVKEQAGAPVPMQFPFKGPLEDGLSPTVFVDNEPVAVVGSIANNQPSHLPLGGPFMNPPTNKATVSVGSVEVFADLGAVARVLDAVDCCNDPRPKKSGHIIPGPGTVYAGG